MTYDDEPCVCGTGFTCMASDCAASQTSASVDAEPHPSLSAPTAQKGTPDLTASAPDLAADVVGTTGPTS